MNSDKRYWFYCYYNSKDKVVASDKKPKNFENLKSSKPLYVANEDIAKRLFITLLSLEAVRLKK